MKAVVDTSAIIWLNKIDRLGLLTKLYEKLIAPPGVFDELRYPIEVVKFVNRFIGKIDFSEVNLDKYENLVRRHSSEFRWKDRTDVEVFVIYKFFSNSDEMLFANKGAKEKFSKYGKVRELSELYKLAEKNRVFQRRDSVNFIGELIKAGYRVSNLKAMRERL